MKIRTPLNDTVYALADLPDLLVVEATAPAVVSLIRYGQEFFTATMTPFRGKVDLMLRRMIELHMRANELAYSVFTVSARAGSETVSVSFAVLFSLSSLSSISTLSSPLFLSDLKSMLVPTGVKYRVSVFSPVRFSLFIQVPQDMALKTVETIPLNEPGISAFEIDPLLLCKDGDHPKMVRLLVAPSGNQQKFSKPLHIFYTDRALSAAIEYRNSFNCTQVFHSFGKWELDSETSYSVANVGSDKAPYDMTRDDKIEIVSHPLDIPDAMAALMMPRVSGEILLSLYQGRMCRTFGAVITSADIGFSVPADEDPVLKIEASPKGDAIPDLANPYAGIFTGQFATQFK